MAFYGVYGTDEYAYSSTHRGDIVFIQIEDNLSHCFVLGELTVCGDCGIWDTREGSRRCSLSSHHITINSSATVTSLPFLGPGFQLGDNL
jgi:hypothetical protein